MKKLLWSSLLFLSLLVITACDNSSKTSTIDPFSNSNEEDYSEFEYNYSFLYFYYYKAGTELKSQEYYTENVDTSVYKVEFQDVADVLFMYEDMSDLFTKYYPSAYFDELWALLTESESNKTVGVAVDSSLTVKRVYPNSSAYSAGVKKGDIVIAVDSIFLEGNYDRYTKLVDSSTASTFKISFDRGGDTLKFSLLKTEILLPTVYLDSINGIPVITVTEFTDSTSNINGTSAEFSEILEETNGAKSTVLDLRGNPGGSVDQCSDMAKMLLARGDTIIRGTYAVPDKDYKVQVDSAFATIATTNGIGKGRYYVLMLDSGSASCSEIFAAAITSNLKTPIVGELSYGKGIGQFYIVTNVNGIASATSLRLFDKDGVSYHTYGFVPDFVISDPDSAMNKAVELAQKGTYKRTAGYGTTPIGHWTGPKTKKSAGTASIKNFERDGAFKIIQLPKGHL
jgi:carboxyl-terminal processing protease